MKIKFVLLIVPIFLFGIFYSARGTRLPSVGQGSFRSAQAQEPWQGSLLAYSAPDSGNLGIQSGWKFKIAHDAPLGRDKIEHLMNFLGVTFFCHKGFGLKLKESFYASSGLALFWEIKDSAVDWQDERFIITIFGQRFHLGGDDFSIWDLGWSVLGSGTYYLLAKER